MQQHVIVLLDISHSMYHRLPNIETGLNKFVEKLKSFSNSSDILFSLVLFSDRTIYMYNHMRIQDVQRISKKNMITYGSTYLYDAIADVISSFVYEQNICHNLYIITDGEDTGSKSVTREQASQMCDECVKNGWNITHCDVDISKLTCDGVCKIVYDVNDIEKLFENLII